MSLNCSLKQTTWGSYCLIIRACGEALDDLSDFLICNPASDTPIIEDMSYCYVIRRGFPSGLILRESLMDPIQNGLCKTQVSDLLALTTDPRDSTQNWRSFELAQENIDAFCDLLFSSYFTSDLDKDLITSKTNKRSLLRFLRTVCNKTTLVKEKYVSFAGCVALAPALYLEKAFTLGVSKTQLPDEEISKAWDSLYDCFNSTKVGAGFTMSYHLMSCISLGIKEFLSSEDLDNRRLAFYIASFMQVLAPTVGIDWFESFDNL